MTITPDAYRATIVQQMTEAQLRDQHIIPLANTLGWRCYWTWTSLHSPSGFPDLVLVKPPRLVVAELKMVGRYPTLKQCEWLEALEACGVETHIWTPKAWLDGRIEAVLRGEATP